MKRFLAILFAVCVLCSSVSAVELDSSSSDEQTGEDVSKIEAIIEEIPKESPVVDVSGQEVPSGSSDSKVSSGGSPIYVLEAPASSGGVDYGDLTDIPVGASIDNITVTSVSPVEPGDTTGLKSALLGVLGNYDPVIVEYQYSDGDGRSRFLREVQPDYVWLCSCALLALVIYCLFRLGGALIRE